MVLASIPSSASNGVLKSRMLVALQAVRNFFRWICRKFKDFPALIARHARKFWYGADVEEPKVITEEASCYRIVRKCAIHVLPMSAACILTRLNTTTYFVGSEYTGYNSGKWQDFDNLALQIVAKLYELLIVASLATILMDILRHQLITSPGGLPLGILPAKSLFVDATYLVSHEFLSGIISMGRWRGIFLAVAISTCTAIALLAGPSSALLLIPQTYDNWHAGGATFYLEGSNATTWPSQLESESIGGKLCDPPSENVLMGPLTNLSHCVWSGSKAVSQQWQLVTPPTTLFLQDGLVRRNIYVQYYSLSAAAFGVSLSPLLYSRVINWIFRIAMFNAKSAKTGTLLRLSNLKTRKKEGTATSINSQIPVVRTTCLTNQSVNFADIVNQTYFPLQLEYPSDYLQSLVEKGEPYDSTKVLGRQYAFNGTMYVKSPRIASLWLETPQDEPIGTRISDDVAVGRSSAYLNVQIPYPNSTIGFHAACSIDARWVESHILGSSVAEIADTPLYQAPPFGLRDPSVFPAESDGNWRTVRLRQDWLNALTPALDNVTHWNTLSDTFSKMGLSNTTGLVVDYGGVGTTIAAVVSTVVADGMSRRGYDKAAQLADETWAILGPEDVSTADPILDDSFVLPTPITDGENTTSRYKVDYSVTVTGMGYRINSTAYGLALAVLLLHVLLAACHIIWVCISYKNGSSTSWSSLTDLLVLALRSTPSRISLENASAGVSRYRTFKEPVRIRAFDNNYANGGASLQNGLLQGSEGVDMVVGVDYVPGRHKDIVKGEAY